MCIRDRSRVEGIFGDYIPRVWAENEKDRLTLSQALQKCAEEIDQVIAGVA